MATLLVLAALDVVASAQPSTPARTAPPSSSDSAPASTAPSASAPPPEYGALADRALAESAAGRWAEARALFVRAHAIYPNARSSRAIGMASYELRDYPEAYRALRASLSDTRRALDASQRAQVEALLEEVVSFLGRYTLASMPADAVYLVDGARVDPSVDGMLCLRIGRHEVEVRSSDERFAAAWNVTGGELAPLPVTSARGATMGTSDPSAASSTSSQATGSSDPPRTSAPKRRVTRLVLISGGGAAMAVGAVFLALGAHDRSHVESAPRGTDWSSVASAYDRVPRRMTTGAALLSAGAASVGLGIVLTLRRRDEHREVHAYLAPENLHLRIAW